MKIYFDSNFKITKREYEDYYRGSEYHNKIEVYFPKMAYMNYNYIYPVFNVKRPDNRQFGEFILSHLDNSGEPNYVVWWDYLPSKALEVEGSLEITILFKYSDDGLYAKTSTGKVLLNVKDAVINEEDDIIYVGNGESLRTEINIIKNDINKGLKNVILPNEITSRPNYIVYHILTNYGEGRYLISREGGYSTSMVFTADNVYSNSYNWTLFDLQTGKSYKNMGNVVDLDTITSADDLTYETIVSVNNKAENPTDAVSISRGGASVFIEDGDIEIDDGYGAYFGLIDGFFGVSSNGSDENVHGNKEISIDNSFIVGANDIFLNSSGDFERNVDGTIFDIAGGVVLEATHVASITGGEDITLNGNSWNETYNKVEEMYGNMVFYKKDEDVAHTKVVPENVGDYASIDKIGGMTYLEKSENLCILEDIAETTTDGITYSINNGVITLNGTAIAYTRIYLNLKKSIASGIYNFSTFNNTTLTIPIRFSIDGVDYQVNSTYYSSQMTTNDVIDSSNFYIIIEENSSFDNFTIKPMIVVGTTAPKFYQQGFEPYFVDTKVNEVKVVDNYIKINNYSESRNAYEYSNNINGWINVAKNTTGSMTLTFNQDTYIPAGTYAIKVIFKNNKRVHIGSVCFRYDANDDSMKQTWNNLNSDSGTITLVSPAVYTYIWTRQDIEIPRTEFKIILTNPNNQEYILTIPESIQNLEGYGLSVPNTDIRNEVDFDNNKYIRRCASYTFNGNETLQETLTSSSSKRYWFYIDDIKVVSATTIGNISLNGLETRSAGSIWSNDYNGIGVEASLTRVSIHHKDYQTAEDMLNFLKGKTLIYEIANYEITTLPEEIDNIIPVKSGQEVEFSSDNNRAVPSDVEYMEVK